MLFGVNTVRVWKELDIAKMVSRGKAVTKTSETKMTPKIHTFPLIPPTHPQGLSMQSTGNAINPY